MNKEFKERPILFKAEMVNAILDGSKTQTRRIVKPQPDLVANGIVARFTPDDQKLGRLGEIVNCPFGKVGDQLWVRETFCSSDRNVAGYKADALCGAFGYDGDGNKIFVKHGYILDHSCKQTYQNNFEEGWNTFGLGHFGGKWKPSIFMPKWLSRIQLEITNIRIERLNDISEEDAIAEGIERGNKWLNGSRNYYNDNDHHGWQRPVDSYRSLWESINGKGSWAANPWVWIVEFKKI